MSVFEEAIFGEVRHHVAWRWTGPEGPRQLSAVGVRFLPVPAAPVRVKTPRPRARTASDLALANRVFRAGRALDLAMVRTMLAKLKTDKDRIRELLTLMGVYRRNVTLKLMALQLCGLANNATWRVPNKGRMGSRSL